MSKTCDRLANNRCVLFFLCLLRWIPVLFITTCIAWSYYAYVYELCVKTVSNTLEKCLYLFLYHIVLGIFVWSYYQVTFTNLGVPPKHFGIPDDLYERIITAQNVHTRRALLEDFARNLPVVTRTYDGSIRFCDRCRIVKPDRCHHCSVCRQCVMKMDHHCPWVNTCVSFTNYKFFILFLGYAMVYCLYVALTDLKYFIGFWTDGYANDSGSAAGKFHIMFLFFVACMFFISVSVLFWYHIWLSCMNRSTLESFRSPVFRSGPDKNGFNLGYRANFQEVFGDRTFLWFLPVFTAMGDGSSFPSTDTRVSYNSPPSAENGYSSFSDVEFSSVTIKDQQQPDQRQQQQRDSATYEQAIELGNNP